MEVNFLESQLSEKLNSAYLLVSYPGRDEYIESNPEFAQDLKSVLNQLEEIIEGLEKKPVRKLYKKPEGTLSSEYIRRIIQYLTEGLTSAISIPEETAFNLNNLINRLKELLVQHVDLTQRSTKELPSRTEVPFRFIN